MVVEAALVAFASAALSTVYAYLTGRQALRRAEAERVVADLVERRRAQTAAAGRVIAWHDRAGRPGQLVLNPAPDGRGTRFKFVPNPDPDGPKPSGLTGIAGAMADGKFVAEVPAFLREPFPLEPGKPTMCLLDHRCGPNCPPSPIPRGETETIEFRKPRNAKRVSRFPGPGIVHRFRKRFYSDRAWQRYLTKRVIKEIGP